MGSDDLLELYAVFHGMVQGVCFRATVQDHAKRHQICGTVRNCTDGTVELVAQGTQMQLSTFLDAIKREPGYAKITSVDTSYRQPALLFDTFRVIHAG